MLSAADKRVRDAEDAIYSAEAWASRKLHRGADQASAYGNEARKDVEASYDSAVAKGQELEQQASGWFSSAKKNVASTADELSAEARAAKDQAAHQAHQAYDVAATKGQEVENKASGWLQSAKGSVQETAAEGKAKAASLERQASAKGHEVAADAKATGNSWLNWGSAKTEEVKGDVRDAAAQTSDRVADAEARARQSLQNGVNRAEGAAYRTRADVRDATTDLKEDAKAEGRSWFNWFGAKKDDAADAASRKAVEARDAATPVQPYAQPSQVELMQQQAALDARNVKAQAHIDAEKVKGYTNEKVEEAKSATSSWLNWGSAKTDQAKATAAQEASGAKDSLKSALLTGEKKVEEGAQRAQVETRKL